MYPYSHLGQTIPGGHGYTALQGYAMPGHQIVQFGGPSVNTMTTSSLPTIQAPYPTGKFPLTQLLFYSPQLMCFFFFLSVLICLCIYLVVGCNLWFVCCGWWNFELWIKLFHNIKWVPIRVLSRFFHCNLLSQVWQVQFPHSLSLYFLLILLSSCKVVVLTKILDEGLIRSVARTCRLVVVFFPNPLEPLLSWCFLI